MRAFFVVLLMQFFCVHLHGNGDVDQLQTQLNAVYSNVDQIYREAVARGTLSREDLKPSKASLDKSLPSLENLFFILKRQQEPALSLRRQSGLAVKYQQTTSQTISQVQDIHTAIGPQIKEMCLQIEKWKSKPADEGKREKLLSQANLVLENAISKMKKIHELMQFANKTHGKLTAFRDQMNTFTGQINTLNQQAGALAPPAAQSQGILAKEQKELTVIPLRLKTLAVLESQSKALLQQLKEANLPLKDVQYAEEQVDIINGRLKEVQALNEDLTSLNEQISKMSTAFDQTFKSFNELAASIIAPFQNGLQSSIEEAFRLSEAQLASVSSLEADALVNIQKLHACIASLQKKSDLAVVPNVIGQSFEEAVSALQQAQLKPMRKGGEPAPRREVGGKVYEQDPAPNVTVAPNSPVAFRIYEAYVPLVPDLSGKTLEDAQRSLKAVGLLGAPQEGEVAPDKESEGKIYSQSPRAYTTVQDGSTVNFTYYAKAASLETEQKYSSTPFYVLCRLYVPKLKPNSPSKPDLTINDVNFVQRKQPFVFVVQGKALERYSLSFFSPNKPLASFIQITGNEASSGLISQYDGALLLEVAQVFKNMEDLKQKTEDLIDFTEQDPLSYIILSEGNGLFSGKLVHDNVQLKWTGGPLVSEWSARMKNESFSLFRQLL